MTEQLPLHGIAIYNPGILSPEELRRYFVARQPLLDRLLDGLRREKPNQAPQHRLIVGTRGMGKTTLLHRFALGITEDEVLNQHWLPLKFPEEQYNITRLSDLWANCLDALGDQLEASGQNELLAELDARVDDLPAEEEARAEQALRALMDFADRLERRLLLLIDNLDIVLERLEPSHWAIREVLGHEPRLMLLGASARALESTYEYKAAFYDFFKIHELKGLDETEMRTVLCRLAEVDGNSAITQMIEQDPGRIRTLHTLTGGNPRTAVLLYGVLAQGIEGDVRSDLERLLDQCTPLYKARFEELAPQAQKIVDAMAIHWDPLTAAHLAELTRLPVNTVSTQLTRLEQQGVSEKVPLRPGKKNGFQIAERFFNIWYLMRTSRRVRRRLVWLVQFLKAFYSQDQLRERARRHLINKATNQGEACLRHAEYAFSIAHTVEDQTLRSALETSAIQTLTGDRKLRHELNALIEFEDSDSDLKDRAERIRFMQELPSKVLQARKQWPAKLQPKEFADALQKSLGLTPETKRLALEELPNQTDEQILETQEQLQFHEQEFSQVLLEHTPLLNELHKAVTEGLMSTIADETGARIAAEAIPSDLLAAYADTLQLTTPAPLTLEELHLFQKTIEALDLGFAWNTLGNALSDSGDLTGAIDAYRKQLDIKPDHEWAWYNLGNALSDNGQLTGAIDAYRKQLDIKPDHEGAWNNLGIALSDNGDLTGAIDAYRKQLDIKPDDKEAWNNLGIALKGKGDLTGAIDAYRKQLNIEPDHELAWYNLGIALKAKGDLTEAIDAYRKQLDIKPDHEWAWHNLGIALSDIGDLTGAIDAFRKQLAIKPDHERAWNSLGNALSDNGDLTGAIEAYRKQLDIKPDHEAAWNNLGVALSDNGDLTGAIDAYRKQLDIKPDHEAAWNNLGIALSDNGDLSRAIDAWRQGMQHASTRGLCHNGMAWHFFEHQQNLDDAETLAREAVRLDPENLNARHTLATVLATNNHWPEAQAEASQLLALCDDDWLATHWDDMLLFFREAIRKGHAAESTQLLEATQTNERLRPLHTALLALAEGPDQLTRVAPEVRQPAEAIMERLTEDTSPLEQEGAD